MRVAAADEPKGTPLTGDEPAGLPRRIGARVRHMGLTQTAAADELGLTQPRLNALLKGRVELFSLDALVGVAARMELTVRISATRPYNRG